MNEDTKINCAIFQKQESGIGNIAEKINNAKEIHEKAELAEEMQKEVEVFFSCTDYDESSMDCKSCRCIANLRKKTAELIIKTKSLTEQGE